MAAILVIGYGNRMRGDDGVGPEAAMRLMARTRGCDTDVLIAHQLTPELAEPIAGSELVLFIDASCEGEPGTLACVALEADGPPSSPAVSHQVDPAGLLVMAGTLFGHRPRAFMLSIAAESFEVGEGLSDTVESALEPLLQRAETIIHEHCDSDDRVPN